MPWSLDICSIQHLPVHIVGTHGASNQDTHLYPLHSNSSVYLTTTTYVRRSEEITNGMRSGRTRHRIFNPDTSTHPLESTSQEEPVSDLTASAPVLDVYAPAYANGVWPPLRPVSAAQKNKRSTMLSSNVLSIDLPTDCMA